MPHNLVSDTYSSLPKIHPIKYNFEPKPKVRKKFKKLKPIESEPILMQLKPPIITPQIYTAQKKYRFKKLNFRAQYKKIHDVNESKILHNYKQAIASDSQPAPMFHNKVKRDAKVKSLPPLDMAVPKCVKELIK